MVNGDRNRYGEELFHDGLKRHTLYIDGFHAKLTTYAYI